MSWSDWSGWDIGATVLTGGAYGLQKLTNDAIKKYFVYKILKKRTADRLESALSGGTSDLAKGQPAFSSVVPDKYKDSLKSVVSVGVSDLVQGDAPFSPVVADLYDKGVIGRDAAQILNTINSSVGSAATGAIGGIAGLFAGM